MIGSAALIKLWEEAICPVCLDPPHNAVLLRCSSYEKGCRPFMCNTSLRHSNCLDQFRKSTEPSSSSVILPGNFIDRTNEPPDDESPDALTCPLCRGRLYGWFVIEPARKYMNSKTRSCSNENCEFSGNYTELREHARSDHPDARPSVVDPERLEDWMRVESEITLESFLDSFPVMNLFDDFEMENPFVIPPIVDSGFEEEAAQMILDALNPNLDSMNTIDDDFCLDSLFFRNIALDPPGNIELLDFTTGGIRDYEFRGLNTNTNTNQAGNNLIHRSSERVSRNNRNRDIFGHSGRRQSNSFRGSYMPRMRESRVGRSGTYRNSRNGSERRGNRNGNGGRNV